MTGKPVRRRRQQQPPPERPTEPSSMPGVARQPEPIPLVQARSKSSDSRPAAQGARPTADHPLIGRVIGDKYGVRAVIGEGGMGTVYEAEHLTIGRKVAIKVLNRAHLGRREAVARFHQEARAAGAIGHPNICEIYDVGNLDDGSPYLVMERLHGKTLADRINLEGALPFEDVITALTQVLSALVAAHHKNIIHRDVKPENIFLSERVGCTPVVKILDFGISKFEGEDPDLSLTRTGMVMGTPFYMAPEQARGEIIDHRVDVYACGVMLYEALTGRRPFIANNYNALVVQILATQPKDPREIRPAIPAGFVPLIFKALAKKREDRYRNAEAFLKDLLLLQEELARNPAPNELGRRTEDAQSSAPAAPPSTPPLSSDSIDIPVVFSETGTGSLPTVNPTTAELQAAQEASGEDDATMVDDSEEIQAALALQRRSAPRLRAYSDPGNEDAHDTIVDPSGALLREIWAQLPPGQNPQALFHNRDAAVDATEPSESMGTDKAEEVVLRVDVARSERGKLAGRYSLTADVDEPTYADEANTERGELPELEPAKRAPQVPRREPPEPRGLAAYMAMSEENPAHGPAASGATARREPPRAAAPLKRESAPRPAGGTPLTRGQPVPKPARPSPVRPEQPGKRAAGPATRPTREPAPKAVHETDEADDDAVTTLFSSTEGAKRDGTQEGAPVNTTERSAARSSDSSPTIPRAPRPPGTPRL